MNALVFSLSLAAIAWVLFLLSKQLDTRIAIGATVLCALYVGLDDYLTGLPTVVTSLGVIGDRWNWMGKLFSLILSATMLLALRFSPETIGLTWRQRHPLIGVCAVMLSIVWGACLGIAFRPGPATAETLAFQATMPGLAEELVYRGIVPALLLGLIGGKAPVERPPWGVIVAIAVLFGVLHGLQYMDGKYGFDVQSALFPMIASVPGGWLRFKTGSLLVPVLVHSLANVAFHVAGSLSG